MNLFKKIKNYYSGIYSIKDDYENQSLNRLIYFVSRFFYGIIHPKIFYIFFKNFLIDSYNSYLFINSVSSLRKFFFKKDFNPQKKNVLAICLRGMEECFFQIWYIMVKKIYQDSNFIVLSLKSNKKINFLCKILGIKLFYFEDISKKKIKLNKDLIEEVNYLKTESDFLNFKYNSCLCCKDESNNLLFKIC